MLVNIHHSQDCCTKVRNSNFELLRIVSILAIYLMHTVGYAGCFGVLSTANMYLRCFEGSIGDLGVSCFILISGYFGVTFKKRKFIKICYLTTLYAMLATFANNGFSWNNRLIMDIFIIPRYFNWYITCYLVLMLVSSPLNRFCSSMEKSTFQKLLLCLFVMFSIFPMMASATDSLVNYSGQCISSFVFTYLIGRYIRLYKDHNYSKGHMLLVFLMMTTVMTSLMILSVHFSKLRIIPVTSNYSPFILVSSISIFYLFKSFKFKSKAINYISASVLSVYLLDWARPSVDRYIMVYSHSAEYSFWWYVAIEVVLLFAIALVIDKLRVFLLERFENKLIGGIETFIGQVFVFTKSTDIYKRLVN